jgi:hypothetical protein
VSVIRRDGDRAQVYAAESAAFEGTGYELTVAFDELLRLSERVTAGDWWVLGPVEIRASRSDARSSATRWTGEDGPVIHLAGPQMTMATLAHELAHALAGRTHGHDSVYRRAHLDVVGVLLGEVPRVWLEEAYRLHGLRVGHRRWSTPPPPTPRGPIAL